MFGLKINWSMRFWSGKDTLIPTVIRLLLNIRIALSKHNAWPAKNRQVYGDPPASLKTRRSRLPNRNQFKQVLLLETSANPVQKCHPVQRPNINSKIAVV